MPIIKPISGHTSTGGVFRYLTKGGRALACDYLNMDAPVRDTYAPLPEYEPSDWGAAMDETRRLAGNDVPWRGKRVRTYKHYVLSPDPDDVLSLDSLRELTMAWVRENFPDFEVAVVYHDDNLGRIPHAHVVVNNTNVENGLRLQDPEPRALKRSVQRLAKERSLSYLKDAPRGEERLHPPSLQQYTRRAEVQLRSQGQYSWVADIRARVKVARAAAHSEAEFRSLLGALGIDMSDNSAKAARADWVYSLVDAPTRRVSGEKLGLAYGRESLLARFDATLPAKGTDAYAQRLADIAKQAVAVADLAQLQRLADAVTLIERGQIRSSIALDAYMRRPYQKQAWNDLDATQAKAAQEFIKEAGVLPFRTQRSGSRTGRTSQEAYADTRPARRSEQTEDDGALSRQQEGRSAQAHVRTRNDQER